MSLRARFMLSHPAHFMAFGFGAGLSPVGPGTAGTLLAFPLYALLSLRLSSLGILVFCVVLYGAGVWACERTAVALGVRDPGGIVWDEIVAFLVVLCFTPAGWLWQAGAFALFRFFDIVKPPPIGHADRRFKGGFGVMFDDLLAAGYTLLVLAAIRSISG
jgi:phosphatidylglycerophosphatase A